MKTKINVSNYKRVESINLFGVWFNSVYNHNYYYNYYYNNSSGDLILEISDDFDTYQYYRIKEDGYSYIKEYLGTVDAIWGIFDNHNNDQYVELNSEVH
jgi:hypothetical protein